MPSDLDLLSPLAATPGLPRPRGGLLVPTHVLERRDSTGGVLQRGMVGRLDIRGADSGHILPHTRVSEAGVTLHTRLLLEQHTPAPLLLASPDIGGFAACLTATAARHPDRRITTADAGELRLWSCDPSWRRDPPPLGPVLVADGHHRLEAARRLHRAPAGRAVRMPALVVDHASYPLRLSAMHRSIPRLDLSRALALAGRFARMRPRGSVSGGRPPPRGSVLLTGRGLSWEVSGLSAALLGSRLGRLPPEWVEVDAAVSDHALIPLLCEDQGIEPVIRYTPELPGPGETGVVLSSPTWNQVWSGAASGRGLPVQSTCLHPQPPPDLFSRLD